MSKSSILLIGGGNMGRALLSAWRQANVVDRVTVVDPHPVLALATMADVVPVLEQVQGRFDAVILATKPQIASEVMPAIAAFVTETNFFLSIAAGKTTAFFQDYLGHDKAIIRAMPNTPCQIQKGITALYATPSTSAAARHIAHDLFAPTGLVFDVTDEDRMHAITAITASGPGFLFYAMEVLMHNQTREAAIATIESCAHPFYTAYVAAARHYAIADKALLEKIITQLFKGSAALAEAQPHTAFADLRRAVTSPNGTTQAGLDILMTAGDEVQISERIAATFEAATQRSRELAR